MTASPVLAATDGSPVSLAAVHWAADEALRRGTALRLVHVWPRPVGVYLDRLQAEGARVLALVQDEVARRHPALEVDSLLLGAATVDALTEAAADGQLLVVGSRGLGGFKGLLVGSVSLAVASRSPIPVVVLRPGTDDAPAGDAASAGDTAPADAAPAGDVVVGVDSGETADEVLEFAFSRAERRGSRVVAVHAFNLPVLEAIPGTTVPPVDATEIQSGARKHLVETLRPWQDKYPQVPIVVRIDAAGPAKALVDASDGAELLVIGRRIHKHGAAGHLGFAAHAALHHAHAPVAVVPHL